MIYHPTGNRQIGGYKNSAVEGHQTFLEKKQPGPEKRENRLHPSIGTGNDESTGTGRRSREREQPLELRREWERRSLGEASRQLQGGRRSSEGGREPRGGGGVG